MGLYASRPTTRMAVGGQNRPFDFAAESAEKPTLRVDSDLRELGQIGAGLAGEAKGGETSSHRVRPIQVGVQSV